MIAIKEIKKGGTEFGVHYWMDRAACGQRGELMMEDKRLREASGMTFEQAAAVAPDDDEGLATGTVGHAILARLFQPDVFGKLTPSSVREMVRDPASLVLPPLDKPWTRKADVRLARSAAGYVYAHLAPYLTDARIIGAELSLRSELAYGPLTGDLDLVLVLGPESVDNMTIKFGGIWRRGLTIFDWKFLSGLHNSWASTKGHQWLSYMTLGNRWASTLTEKEYDRVANFAFVCINKTTAKVHEPKHDMVFVSKTQELVEPERYEQAMERLQSGTPNFYNHDACVGDFGRKCRYHPAEGGRCTLGLFD